MNTIAYPIQKNNSVVRWWVSEVGKRPFQSPMATFNAEINPGEGYVQIIYPVREKFLEEAPIQQAQFKREACNRLYFPFENNRVDFTTFIHTPHYLWVHALTGLTAPQAGEYPFELYTCGGVKIWVNGQQVCCFTPYTRNIATRLQLALPLNKGENEITVYADELAERDVFFYFELRYMGGQKLTNTLQTDLPPQEPARTEAFLQSCYFPRDTYEEGAVTLCFSPDILDGPTKLYVLDEKDAAGQKYNSREMQNHCIEIVPGQSRAEVGVVEDYPVGMFALLLCCEVGRHQIVRRMMIGTVPPEQTTLRPEKTLGERKQQALQFIAQNGESVVNRALAALEGGSGITEEVFAFVDNSLKMVERHDDCADFYLPVLLLLLQRYPGEVSAQLAARIRHAVLHFRYWIDEPGDDVMWYFSENHALLFHIGQYLAGHAYPNEIFPVSGRTGKEQYRTGRERILNWFVPFFAYGYAEWNSATYLPVDLIGFFVLYLLAPDEEIQEKAKQGLDYTFRIMEYNSFGGIMASSYGRAYEETLKGYSLVEPNFLTWITYGQGTLTSASRAAALYCLSDYCPESNYKQVQLGHKQWLELEWDQGVNKAKTYSFRTSDYCMACVRRYRPFTHGHQQHLMHVALGGKSAPFYLNHPGEHLFSGGNRPAYWAGNGTMPYIEQYRSLMVLVYQTQPEELVKYIHAYAPLYLYDEQEIYGNWFFARVQNAYLAVWFSNGASITQEGANTGKELVANGTQHTVLVRCGNPAEFGSYAAFKAAMDSGAPAAARPLSLRFTDPAYGTVELEGPKGLHIGEKAVDYTAAPAPKLARGCFG